MFWLYISQDLVTLHTGHSLLVDWWTRRLDPNIMSACACAACARCVAASLQAVKGCGTQRSWVKWPTSFFLFLFPWSYKLCMFLSFLLSLPLSLVFFSLFTPAHLCWNIIRLCLPAVDPSHRCWSWIVAHLCYTTYTSICIFVVKIRTYMLKRTSNSQRWIFFAFSEAFLKLQDQSVTYTLLIEKAPWDAVICDFGLNK